MNVFFCDVCHFFVIVTMCRRGLRDWCRQSGNDSSCH